MRIKIKLKSQRNSTYYFILISVTIISRVFLILNVPFFQGQDAYYYFVEAKEFASLGTIKFEDNVPFIFILGMFLNLFKSNFDEFLVSRLFLMTISILTIIVIYLIGSKISGKMFAFLAAFLAIFEPVTLSYSTSPYNDIFAITMGLIALYFTILDKKFNYILLSLIFFYLAILTRPILYVSLMIALLILLLNKKTNIISKQYTMVNKFIIFAYFLPILFLPFFYQILFFGRLGIIERFILFLKPELLLTILKSTFSFYIHEFPEQIIIVVIGLILAFLNIVVRSKREDNVQKLIQYKNKDVKDSYQKEKIVIALSLFSFFAIYIISLTIFAFGYEWKYYISDSDLGNLDIVKGALIINPKIPIRYLIPLKLLITYPLVYPIFLIMHKIYYNLIYSASSKSNSSYSKKNNDDNIEINKDKNKKIRFKLINFILILILLSNLVLYSISLWQKSFVYSTDNSIAMNTYAVTSEWLSKNLKEDEYAIVPCLEVFQALNPKLRYKLVDYQSIWDSAGVKFHQHVSPEFLLKLQNYFIDFLKENPNISYIIRDWVDPYCQYIFEDNFQLLDVLGEVKEIHFTLSTGWINKISMFKILPYTNYQ